MQEATWFHTTTTRYSEGTVMTKRAMSWSVAILALLNVAGCSTPIYEGRYAWSDGWRIGKVSRLLSADEAAEIRGVRCPGASKSPAGRIVVIKWRQVNRTRWHFALLHTGTNIAPGDEVYFNALGCDVHPVARSDVLPR